ncbi:MAG: asparaginase [Clostridia bacterium]|nr:asparaginase [Clostridia bacterium]
MKILFVFTGGTIGSSVYKGVADADRSVSNKIGNMCLRFGDTADFAFPYNILSENAICSTLSDIFNFMLSVDYDKYDGIIMTHGSDTLAYTANLLGLALSWVSIPIIITAADHVMSDPRSNGAENLSAAYALIKSIKSGVFAVWKNTGEKVLAHLAAKLLEADGCDKFSSWGGAAAGIYYNENWQMTEIPAPCDELRFLKNQQINIQNNVMLLHSYVGLDYSAIDLTNKSAVLLKLYHSGTACMAGGSCSFDYLVDMCKKSGTDLYITPIKNGSYIYSTAKNITDFAKPICGMSEFAAYTRLLLAYSLEGTQRENVLRARIY